MRKLLLATSALVAFAAPALAAESPIAVNVGGYVDFRAALNHESSKAAESASRKLVGGDFQNEFRVNFEATGKASNGIEYGAKVGMWNGKDFNGSHNGNEFGEHDASVWMSGSFGKAIFGDAHSANTDLFVSAPTVGEGQIEGSYTNFVSSETLARITPMYADMDNNDTRVTYYTPKVGNADHKVQVGVSFTPEYSKQGTTVASYTNQQGNYKNVTDAAMQYTGKFGSVGALASVGMGVGSANNANVDAQFRDFTAYSAGMQLTYAGVTVGGSYVDAGHMGAIKGQNKAQDVWTFGAKYGFDKVQLAASVLDGRGYSNELGIYTGSNPDNYVRDIQELGLGATYTWFPGLTTAADAVFFQQKLDDNRTSVAPHNDGHVFMLSQKLAF